MILRIFNRNLWEFFFSSKDDDDDDDAGIPYREMIFLKACFEAKPTNFFRLVIPYMQFNLTVNIEVNMFPHHC